MKEKDLIEDLQQWEENGFSEVRGTLIVKNEKPSAKIELLFSDDTVHLEKVNDNYRLSFFNKDNHWAGDITFSKEGAIINNDLHDE